MSEAEKEVFEFTFACESCGQTVITRTDDNKFVKGCEKCGGRMMYRGMRTLSPEEIEQKVEPQEDNGGKASSKPGETSRIIGA